MLIAFDPIQQADTRVLILGCMPGVASLEAGEYYAYPHNAFWPICGELFGVNPQWDYVRRCESLRQAGVALWDVLHACKREGSLDSAIELATAQPNDFETFFEEHPRIRAVFFNGATPEKIFRRRVLPQLSPLVQSLHFQRLPSTSPAYAGMSREEKYRRWKKAILPWLKD